MRKWSKKILIAIIPALFIVTAVWAISQPDPVPVHTIAGDSSNPGAG
ncbi:hypothetical protein ACFQ49_10405 [Kroppenstedtia eburnea]|nr:hypothetical protein [Kroppenstedtia eburnea]QKI83047.1 hypothetical protein GXN75_14160 [Kroppenstedtia eburnea]